MVSSMLGRDSVTSTPQLMDAFLNDLGYLPFYKQAICKEKNRHNILAN